MSEQMTTYQRIRELLLSGVATIARPYPDLGTQMDADQAARVIADEIDGLIERNAFLLTSAETAQAKLAEARAEVEHLRLPAEAWETLEAAREAGRTGTEEDEDAARSIHKSARDRARAAKVKA